MGVADRWLRHDSLRGMFRGAEAAGGVEEAEEEEERMDVTELARMCDQWTQWQNPPAEAEAAATAVSRQVRDAMYPISRPGFPHLACRSFEAARG